MSRRLQICLRRIPQPLWTLSRNYCCSVNEVHRNPKFKTFIERVSRGPDLQYFFNVKSLPVFPGMEPKLSDSVPYLNTADFSGHGRKVFFEIYGCQMNTNDTEVVWSVLKKNGYEQTCDVKDADVVMLVTCAIREHAEQKIWNRLNHLRALKERRSKRHPLHITVLGCMAERLKSQLLDQQKCVDVIAGPDSYKDLPRLLAISRHYGNAAINVLLSLDETYADVMPVRFNTESPTAFVSIMRGCDNMCTYCIVPFTRGRERSRPIESVVREVTALYEAGVKEVTLLGQNVNSYRDKNTTAVTVASHEVVPGFKTVYKAKTGGLPFSELLRKTAEAVPEMRIRFTSPHPKDFSDDVLHVIRDYPNVCKQLHLPAQSGNSNVLERMRRGYTRQAYLKLVGRIRDTLPDVGLSSDFICGFCGETEEEFQDTITLMDHVKYNVAYLFAYSMREKTAAHRKYVDDVPPEVKLERLKRMSKTFRENAAKAQQKFIGTRQLILLEGKSKRSENDWFGRIDANLKVIVRNTKVPIGPNGVPDQTKEIAIGDFVAVEIYESNSQVLKGTPLYVCRLSDFNTRT